MEKQKDREEWHYNARVRLSQLAMLMYEHFTEGYDAEQSAEYNNLKDQYLQLQADIIEHDRFDPPRYIDYHYLG